MIDPITTKIITGIILLLISTIVGYLVYHNRRKDKRLDDLHNRLHKIEIELAILKSNEDTAYIKAKIDDVLPRIVAIETEIKNLNKKSDIQDKIHYHRRADDKK